jgi:adenosylcobinamide kinase / adenosylcobinamide-phosphate guanylyltransferase
VFVTNEVGMGIVPDNALARAFRDAAGTLNQWVAEAADEVILAVSGLPLKVK